MQLLRCGGRLGRSIGNRLFPVRNFYPERSKLNPKYWGEKLGLNAHLPPIDLNDDVRGITSGFAGGGIEHGFNMIRPNFGGNSYDCQSKKD